MAAGDRKMILGVAMRGTGGHVAGWRHPSVTPQTLLDARSVKIYAEIAKIAEQGKVHFIFLADTPVVSYQSDPALMERSSQEYYVEPITLFAALAPMTKHVGLVGSMSTTYSDPYTVARMIASVDMLSEGRASWNLVTTGTPHAAGNFGRDEHMEKGDRYKRADEFVRIVRGLWDSWEDDAFLRDQAGGRFVDASKMHYLNYKSDEFGVRGPLNIERTPQGHPIVFLAGASSGAQSLAAKQADVMFTAQPDPVAAKAFYASVKAQTVACGRSPDDLSILPGAMVIAGRTDEEAREKHEYLRSFIDLEFALRYLSSMARMDLTKLPLDQPIAPDVWAHAPSSRLEFVVPAELRATKTLRQIAIDYADDYGHKFFVGSPRTIADQMQEQFEAPACDGFLLRAAYFPEGFRDTVTLLVPELQRRGLFQTEYAGKTFRESLGRARPLHPRVAGVAKALAS